MIEEDYKAIAKELGVKLHIGKYGLKFLNRDPTGKIYKYVQLVRLDGWSFEQKDILQGLVDDGFGIKYKKRKEQV